MVVAGEGEPGGAAVVGVLPRPANVYALPGVYLGATPWDRKWYDQESSGQRQAPAGERDMPASLVKARAAMLGIAASDAVTFETPQGSRVRGTFSHGGEQFAVYLNKESKGWVLAGVTWGEPCRDFTLYCPQA